MDAVEVLQSWFHLAESRLRGIRCADLRELILILAIDESNLSLDLMERWGLSEESDVSAAAFARCFPEGNLNLRFNNVIFFHVDNLADISPWTRLREPPPSISVPPEDRGMTLREFVFLTKSDLLSRLGDAADHYHHARITTRAGGSANVVFQNLDILNPL